MDTKSPRALLVGENPHDFSTLAKRLQKNGFSCEFASSSQQALSLARIHDFDLVLSPIKLRNASLLSLMDACEGSKVNLFYFHAVEDGCWWLPAMRRGKQCWGTSAFRPGEFASALDAAIAELSRPCNHGTFRPDLSGNRAAHDTNVSPIPSSDRCARTPVVKSHR
jgi:DNA-binding NtrC family response regulator